MRRPTSAGLLAGLLTSTGGLHFAVPAPFEDIVPRRLGHAAALTYWSGVAEVAVGAAVSHPRTRRMGGFAAAALFVAVFPANVSMALDPARPPRVRRVAVARLPLQLPLIAWALRVAQSAPRA